MIFGAHVIVYSKNATADRVLLKEVLGFSSVDAGYGWLILALSLQQKWRFIPPKAITAMNSISCVTI